MIRAGLPMPENSVTAPIVSTPFGLRECKCSDLGVPAPCGRNIVPMRVYHRRGPLIDESQVGVATAKPLTWDVGVSPTTNIPLCWSGEGGQVEDYARRGAEVDQLVKLDITPRPPTEVPNADSAFPVHGHGGEKYIQV